MIEQGPLLVVALALRIVLSSFKVLLCGAMVVSFIIQQLNCLQEILHRCIRFIFAFFIIFFESLRYLANSPLEALSFAIDDVLTG
jgi:hypothetical protein